MLTRTPSTMLYRRSESWHPYLVPDLRKESIQYSTFKSDAICSFFIDLFLFLLCWEFWSEMYVGLLSWNYFLFIELIMFFFFSVLTLVNYIHWFLNIKPTFYSWNRRHLVIWSIILLLCCLIRFDEILSRIFISTSWGKLVCGFLKMSLPGFGIKVMLAS